jgi:tetratricopeptide (TPR) repeat protein
VIRLSTTLLVTLIVVNLSAQLNASDVAASESTVDDVRIVDNSLSAEYERAKQVYTHLISATYLRVRTQLFPAKEGYQQILRDHETSAFVHTQLASLSMKMYDLPTAERSCRRAIEIDPEQPMPHYLLGQIMISRYGNAKNKDKWGDIIATFQKVVELDPDHYGFERNGRPFSAYYYLGEISEQMGDYQSAANAFKELVRIMPYQPTFYIRLGSLYNQLDNKQEAITAYERAIKINRDLWRAHDALWKLCVEQHDQLYQEDQLDAAAENLRKAIYSYSELRRLAQPANHKHDDELMTYFRARLGSLYVALQRENEAIEVLKTALATAPGAPDANYWLGIAYQEIGNFEQAEHYLRRTIALSPEREEAYNALGYFFADLGTNLDEAMALIQKALKKSPSNGAYLDSLGWAYFKQGKLNDALKQFEKAVSYLPDSVEIQDHLGEVYLKKGLKKEAVAAWQKAIQLAPDNTAILEKLKKYGQE